MVVETINEYDGVQKLMGWYQLAIFDKIVLEDLEEIRNMDDVRSLVKKVQHNGLSHIELFRKQAKMMKKGAPNPAQISELEVGLLEVEKKFLKQ